MYVGAPIICAPAIHIAVHSFIVSARNMCTCNASHHFISILRAPVMRALVNREICVFSNKECLQIRAPVT